jgi:hypothetical protein
MQRTNLKLAIVGAGFRHQDLAAAINRLLPKNEHLSELNITQLVTRRKEPTSEQAAALSRLLGRTVDELFPKEVSV